MTRTSPRPRRVTGAATLLVLALVASACTGARRPDEAAKVSSGTPSTLADGTAVGSTTESTLADGSPAPVTGPDGAVSIPGGGAGTPGGASASRTGGGAAGGTSGGTSTGGSGTAAPPRTQLFKGSEDTIGITPTRLTLCAHAALSLAAAFDTSADDFNVFWTELNRKGGIHGRQVQMTYEDDAYLPDVAVQAATACKEKNPFILLGGIGFDQIPAVRNWAEQNRVPYLHHTATVKGSEGKQFSFTGLPTTERMGEMFAELAVARYRTKKIGIIRRASPNWDPGVDAFKVLAKKYGLDIVAERPVRANQANYTEEILEMKGKGAEVVWGWDNAIAATEMVRQGKHQNYSPTWLLFPFNVTSQNLGDHALNPKLVGIAMFPAYSKGDYSGPFAAYADDMREFEDQYRRHRPNAKLDGFGGDLLFLNWTAQKALADMLFKCGRDCTRNRFIDVMSTYKGRPFPAVCEVDFPRGDGHRGGHAVNVMETYRSPSGAVNWRHTDACVEKLS